VYAYLSDKYLAVPEPASALAVLTGMGGVALIRRRFVGAK